MFQAHIDQQQYSFESAATLFSPTALDNGTLFMLQQIEFHADDFVLDLGCGYGAVGIHAARLIGSERVVMSDKDPLAISCAQNNVSLNNLAAIDIIHSDGFKQIDHNGFSKIICHPPYHSDFQVAKHFIEKGFNRLRIGGRMYMVTRRETWYKNKLSSIFGGVKIVTESGYFVFIAEKRSSQYKAKAKAKTKTKNKNKNKNKSKT